MRSLRSTARVSCSNQQPSSKRALMRDHVPPRLPLLRWWPASTRRSSSPWSTRRSTWRTTCWRGSTNASGSAGCRPSRCPTCRRTAWRSGPASWTCGQCPPPLVMEWESPLLGGFITASYPPHCFHLHFCSSSMYWLSASVLVLSSSPPPSSSPRFCYFRRLLTPPHDFLFNV